MDLLRRRAILQALSAVGVEYGTYALVTRPGSLPLGAFMSWLVEWIWAAGLGLILVFLPLLFPNGRPPSRRWWPVAWLGGLSIGLISGSVSLLVCLLEGRGTADDPPGWLLALLQAGFPLMLLAALLAVIALYLRFLRTRGTSGSRSSDSPPPPPRRSPGYFFSSSYSAPGAGCS